ncbi:S1 family peptidase [Kibdelosporangium philippinense]|uniref:S1 family peptidase n=1 Tax=Kibdelosporangium philippinense TaxID=211113 RepID=A0ABS8ZKQ9_9PSEU|nr:trypsin-like serine protease [Kibdelosporangium philippinense]MCE7008147.1 S1 family peptidase [Kibdelosporangium philippinense]
MLIRGVRTTAIAALAIAFTGAVAAPAAQAIEGGTAATATKGTVQIFYKGEVACSGSLLDERRVITSSRCLADVEGVRSSDLTVRVGDTRLGQGEEATGCGTLGRVTSGDPEDPSTWKLSDIQVLYLDKGVSSKDFAMPTGRLPKVGDTVTVRGYGHGGDLKEATAKVNTVNDVIPGGDDVKEGMAIEGVSGKVEARDVGAPLFVPANVAGVDLQVGFVATPLHAVEIQPHLDFLISALQEDICALIGDSGKAASDKLVQKADGTLVKF